MKDIEDYIDELEDLAWSNADSYKINEVRNKITDWYYEEKERLKIVGYNY